MVETHGLGPYRIGRRRALGLAVLGSLGVTIGSGFLAGDAASRARRLKVVARPAVPVPHHQAPAPVPTVPRPNIPLAAWTKPAYKVSDLMPFAPANAVALTIDDGPWPEWTPRILDLLAKYDVKATFCMIGMQVPQNQKLVRMVHDAGHQIANHTQTHPLRIAKFTRAQVEVEISTATKHLVDVTGEYPRLFRSPGGNWSTPLFEATAAHGMLPIDWDVDPRDWSRPGTDHVINTMLRAKPGDILLCHDGGGDRSQTLSALTTVIPRLKSRGLQFITL
jgi:peptidoglycan-N-acetylglucosamine deacetylase